MRVLIAAHFRSPAGGLHEHVRASALGLAEAGHEVVVVCPPGPFSESLAAAAIPCWTDEDSTDPVTLVDRLRLAERFDIVHAHPGPFRKIALAAARRMGSPFVLTLHSQWLEDLKRYAHDVSQVIAVSPAVRDRVVSSRRCRPDQVMVIPNGFDARTFCPDGWQPGSGRFRIAVASRLDKDKKVLLQSLMQLWSMQRDQRIADIEWVIAGQGLQPERPEAGQGSLEKVIRREAKKLNAAVGRKVVTFTGWLAPAALADMFSTCDAAIAPGRAAVEAMASGLPTIAIGSSSCVGLVTTENRDAAEYCNFGGLGMANPQPVERVWSDILELRNFPARRRRLGIASSHYARESFAQSSVDRTTHYLYERLVREAQPQKSQYAAVRFRPELAVVVMSVGAPPALRRAVESLLHQSIPVEIVVVNSGGGDARAVLPLGAAGVSVVELPERVLPGAARNYGISASTAPFVAFLAADCVAEQGWAAARLAYHRRGHQAVASSVAHGCRGNPVSYASHVSLFARRLSGIPRREALCYGVSYSRALLETCGPFREDVRIGEDTQFNARLPADQKPVWTPEVRTTHDTPQRVSKMVRDKFRRGQRTGLSRPRAVPVTRLLRGAFRRSTINLGLSWRYDRDTSLLVKVLSTPLVVLCSLAYSAGEFAGSRAAGQARGMNLEQRRDYLQSMES